MLRRLLGDVPVVLRRMGLRGFGLLQKVYSMLLGMLGLPCPALGERLLYGGRSEIETNLNTLPPDFDLQTPLVTRGDTTCCSTLPQHLVSTSTHTATASGEFREDTLVASPEETRYSSVNAKQGWFGDERDTKLLSPRSSLSPLPEVGEADVEKGSVDESQALPELSQFVEDLYPVGVDESERYERGVTM